MDVLKDRINLILSKGANVIFTTKAMDDIASKYLVEKGVIGVRRIEKSLLRKIAKMTKATIITTLASSEGDEVFDESYLGYSECVYETNLGDRDYIFIESRKGD